MMLRSCSLNIENCNFTGNTATQDGGGIYLDENLQMPQSSLKNCIFRNNHAEGHGGALFLKKFRVELPDCLFENNSAIWGGALYFLKGAEDSNHFEDSKFTFNAAKSAGGAIYCQDSI